jgi:ribonuclease PH
MRADGREVDQLRPVSIVTGFQKHAEGSALIRWGETHVICAASVEDRVPPFRLDSGGGWVTGEYSMLPRSTSTRKPRRQGGRETEIQRLIGRALRASVELDHLGQRTIYIDCDVIQADGGTRVASITGGFVALALAVQRLRAERLIVKEPLIQQVGAVSVGIVDGEARLDLPYEEDVRAEVDMNLVMTSKGQYVEVQGTAEHAPFSPEQLQALCGLGWRGIQRICELQRQAIAAGAAGPAEVSL